MAYKRILYEKLEGKIAKITMNRPEARNGMDNLGWEEITNAFKEADLDEDINVIILAGAGRDFCIGIDIRKEAPAETEEALDPFARKSEEIMKPGRGGIRRWDYNSGRWMLEIRNLSKPTIAMVHGNVIAQGFFMSSMCDLIVAAENARFIDSLTRFSLAGMRHFIQPWDMGFRTSKWHIWTNEPISAQEAYRLGFVLRVFPLEKLEEETLKMARLIAERSPEAVRLAKMSVNFAWDLMGQYNSRRFHLMSHEMSTILKGDRPMWADIPKSATEPPKKA